MVQQYYKVWELIYHYCVFHYNDTATTQKTWDLIKHSMKSRSSCYGNPRLSNRSQLGHGLCEFSKHHYHHLQSNQANLYQLRSKKVKAVERDFDWHIKSIYNIISYNASLHWNSSWKVLSDYSVQQTLRYSIEMCIQHTIYFVLINLLNCSNSNEVRSVKAEVNAS